jgi:hypothetical protein
VEKRGSVHDRLKSQQTIAPLGATPRKCEFILNHWRSAQLSNDDTDMRAGKRGPCLGVSLCILLSISAWGCSIDKKYDIVAQMEYRGFRPTDVQAETLRECIATKRSHRLMTVVISKAWRNMQVIDRWIEHDTVRYSISEYKGGGPWVYGPDEHLEYKSDDSVDVSSYMTLERLVRSCGKPFATDPWRSSNPTLGWLVLPETRTLLPFAEPISDDDMARLIDGLATNHTPTAGQASDRVNAAFRRVFAEHVDLSDVVSMLVGLFDSKIIETSTSGGRDAS